MGDRGPGGVPVKLARVTFAVPHPNPANPTGIDRLTFAHPQYTLERSNDGVVSISAAGRTVYSTHQCWWEVAEVAVVEPLKPLAKAGKR